MNWIELKIYTASEGIEPLCGRLYSVGVGGVQIEDAQDFCSFIEHETAYWDYIDESLEPLKTAETSVTLYLTDDFSGREQLALIRDTVDALKALDTEKRYGRLAIELKTVDDEDWANNWKQYYKPLELGERILIRPEWVECENPDRRVMLSMNPGHLFGTGTHHSTQLCMLELEKAVSSGDRVLDLGCGSGILSILSLLLGADSACAVDIDPAAPDTVAENLALNSIDPSRYEVLVGNVIDNPELFARIGTGYDIVVANIVADVIIALSSVAFKTLRVGGTFITSGIIGPRAEEVLGALEEAGFVLTARHSQNDWVCLTMTKEKG